MSDDKWVRLAYLLIILASIGGYLLVELRRRPGKVARQGLAWVLIFAGFAAAGALWQQFRADSAPRLMPGGRMEVPLDESGHAQLTAEVDGEPVRFIVDTGATTLALSERDARRVGIDTDTLAYLGEASTANGIVRTADVTLGRITVGEVTDEDVPAVVIDGDLDQSLMGMTFLRRFARVSLEGDMLVLER